MKYRIFFSLTSVTKCAFSWLKVNPPSNSKWYFCSNEICIIVCIIWILIIYPNCIAPVSTKEDSFAFYHIKKVTSFVCLNNCPLDSVSFILSEGVIFNLVHLLKHISTPSLTVCAISNYFRTRKMTKTNAGLWEEYSNSSRVLPNKNLHCLFYSAEEKHTAVSQLITVSVGKVQNGKTQ